VVWLRREKEVWMGFKEALLRFLPLSKKPGFRRHTRASLVASHCARRELAPRLAGGVVKR